MAIAAVGFCVAKKVLTETPPESWLMLGPLPWPHQLFSTLAPAGAVTPTPAAKTLSLTISPASPVMPPDWMLEHWRLTGAPLVFTVGLASFVKTLRSRSAGEFFRLIAI